MIDWAVGIGEICGAIIGAITVSNFIYYNKSQVDKKFSEEETKIQNLIKDLSNNRENLKNEIHDRLNENNLNVQQTMKEFITVVSDLKDTQKDKSVEFIQLLNAVKDELKNDYTSRYNDLLLLINTKANESDFVRLENKFDKVSETLTELKTIIQLQLDEKNKN